LEEKKQEKCPNCGRLIYIDRPSCLYCGWKRPISKQERADLQKKLLGVEAAPQKKAPATPAKTEAPSTCPNCLKPVKSDAKFCTGCGGILDKPKIIKPTEATFSTIIQTATPKSQFSLPSFSPQKRALYKHPTHILWLIGAFLFFVTILLPFGILPPIQAHSGVGDPFPVPFPKLFLIPYAVIFCLMLSSLTDIDLYVISQNKTFRISLAVAGVVFLFFIYSFYFVNRGLFFGLLVFYALYLLAVRTSKKFLERLPEEAALILIADVYILLFTLFLKKQILSTTGAGISANRGFYIHLVAVMLILAGCLLNISKPASETPPDLSG